MSQSQQPALKPEESREQTFVPARLPLFASDRGPDEEGEEPLTPRDET